MTNNQATCGLLFCDKLCRYHCQIWWILARILMQTGGESEDHQACLLKIRNKIRNLMYADVDVISSPARIRTHAYSARAWFDSRTIFKAPVHLSPAYQGQVSFMLPIRTPHEAQKLRMTWTELIRETQLFKPRIILSSSLSTFCMF